MFEVITSLGCAIDNLLYERPVVGMYAPHHRIYCWFNRGIVLEDAIGFVRPDSLSTVRFPTEATCVTEPLCFGQVGFTAAQPAFAFCEIAVGLRERQRALLLGLKQARVFDRDHRLVGEVLEKRDLLGGERSDFPSPHKNYANWGALPQQWRRKRGTVA